MTDSIITLDMTRTTLTEIKATVVMLRMFFPRCYTTVYRLLFLMDYFSRLLNSTQWSKVMDWGAIVEPMVAFLLEDSLRVSTIISGGIKEKMIGADSL